MSVRDRLSGIWLMATTLLALFAYTIYFVAQMWLNVLHALFLTLVVLQIAALILYLWGPEKLKSWPMKLLYRLLYLSSLFVIPAFAFIFMGLISQYHVPIPDSIPAASMPSDQILPQDHSVIYSNFPHRKIDQVIEENSSEVI